MTYNQLEAHIINIYIYMANYGYNWLYDLIMHHNQQYGYGFSWDINGVNIMGHTGILYFDVNDNEHDMKFECV